VSQGGHATVSLGIPLREHRVTPIRARRTSTRPARTPSPAKVSGSGAGNSRKRPHPPRQWSGRPIRAFAPLRNRAHRVSPRSVGHQPLERGGVCRAVRQDERTARAQDTRTRIRASARKAQLARPPQPDAATGQPRRRVRRDGAEKYERSRPLLRAAAADRSQVCNGSGRPHQLLTQPGIRPEREEQPSRNLPPPRSVDAALRLAHGSSTPPQRRAPRPAAFTASRSPEKRLECGPDHGPLRVAPSPGEPDVPTGLSGVPPSGPATPLTAMAMSPPNRSSAPAAISRTTASLTAPASARRLRIHAEQPCLERVVVDDGATEEPAGTARQVGTGLGDPAAGAGFRSHQSPACRQQGPGQAG